MAKRKHSPEWMIARVQEYLSGQGSYQSIAKKNGISERALREWVRKYDANGEEALTDNRGRHKTDEEVDELERLRRENLRLRRRLEEKDMLVELLKKVKELEGM